MIYTFYSYKGGVGRSMALANVAELFYRAGLRVLMVDWDLEAPGLERFFSFDQLEELLDKPGVVNTLVNYKQQMSQKLLVSEEQELPFEKPSQLMIDIHPQSQDKGRLFLLTAGRRSKEHFTQYANSVLTFDWQDFYKNWEGESYLEWLRQQFKETADVVLIDSRTGVTEMGGICTYQLADVIVMFCSANQQCLDGTQKMLSNFTSSHIQKLRGRPLDVVVVPARIENAESQFLDQFQEEFLRRFAQYTPSVLGTGSSFLWQLAIPYIPRYAYRETVAVRERTASAEEMIEAFTRLTVAISRLAPRESSIQTAIPETKIKLGDRDIVGSIVGGHAVITGDSVSISISAAPENFEEALACYLRHLVEANHRLQLQGIRSASGLVSIDLEEVYVTLTATVTKTITEGEAWLEEMANLAPGEARRAGLDRPRQTTQQVKVAVQDALAMHPRLVVLGDPGSGKTTLLRYLALHYARDLAEGASLVPDKLGLDERGRLPILLPLRKIGAFLQTRPDDGTQGHATLLRFLLVSLENERIKLPEDFFDQYLMAGRAVILLDGLDEVADPDLRRRVSRLVESFTCAYPECRYVVTSRIVGYTGPARLSEEYATTTIRDFSLADVERFLTNWHRLITAGQMGPGQSAEAYAADQTGQLMDAIRANDRIRELAINPLMLTVIAMVHRDRVKLPDRRAELYAEAVDVLLGKWEEAKGLQELPILENQPFDTGDKRLMLQSVALAMHEERQKEISAESLRRLLGEMFYQILGDWHETERAVRRFLRVIEERTGLLAARGEGVYGFSHLTFQEYLAAVAVAGRDDYVDYSLERAGELWWREVILLEAGFLSLQSKERTTRLIQAIADLKDEPEPYHNLVLAAGCLRDVGNNRVVGDLEGEIRQRLRQGLEMRGVLKFAQVLISRRKSLTEYRVRAAQALAQIGGTEHWTKPYGEPDWVEIPAGQFWMGTPEADIPNLVRHFGGKREWYEWEVPRHKVDLPTYQIARVPTTNAQYRLFVEATGYEPPEGWEEDQPPRGKESHPVVNVSWHDALAYCRWLSQVTDKSITLPSEAEWEKAARGPLPTRKTDEYRAREFPWGYNFDPTRCNSQDLGLGDTTPVGIFLEGASPYGVLDLSGNVCGWTWSAYFSYPYDSSDGREDLEIEDNRVVRGGSFQDGSEAVRCSSRRHFSPNHKSPNVGFRIVLSSVSATQL